MKSTYRVTFHDDTFEDVVADDASQAKKQARATRALLIAPDGQVGHADIQGHHSVKVKSVEERLNAVGGVLMLALVVLAKYLDAHFGFTSNPHVLHADVLSLVGFSGTAIGATIAALTAVTGDSAQVKAFGSGKRASILQMWADVQAAGTFRVRSTKFHDNVQGLRFDTIASDLTPILPPGFEQPIESGDNLIVELAGSATAGDIEYVVLLQWYEELSGQVGNFIGPDDIKSRFTGKLAMVENTIATGATAAWAGSEAINAEIDQFHSDSHYALLGYHVDTEVPAIAWRGPDTAAERVGGPGLDVDSDLTRGWFVDLSRATGRKLIPVIKANNKAATNIDCLQDENGADTTVISIYAELRAS